MHPLSYATVRFVYSLFLKIGKNTPVFEKTPCWYLPYGNFMKLTEGNSLKQLTQRKNKKEWF